MRNQAKAEKRVVGFAVAVLLLLAAGCNREGGPDEMVPGRADTDYMAVAYADMEESSTWDTIPNVGRLGHVPRLGHAPSQVLFELRIGTAAGAVGFRIRQSRADEAARDRATSRKARQSDCLSFEVGNLDSRHGGPLCFDLSMAGQGTAN